MKVVLKSFVNFSVGQHKPMHVLFSPGERGGYHEFLVLCIDYIFKYYDCLFLKELAFYLLLFQHNIVD